MHHYNAVDNNQYRHTKEAFFIQSIHAWLAYGWYAQASWTNGNDVNCTDDQLRMVLENRISVEVFPIPDDQKCNNNIWDSKYL